MTYYRNSDGLEGMATIDNAAGPSPTNTAGLLLDVQAAFGALKNHAVPGDEMVDTIGRVKALEGRLAAFRKDLESEVVAGDTGDEFVVTESRSAKRSYNTNGIFAAFARTSTPTEILQALLAEDAVRLTWRWTQLQAAAQRHDVMLAVAKHEIEDGDPDALVGEVWSSRTSVVPKETT